MDVFRPGLNVYFVGIKGTGMCALAELVHRSRMRVCGSDRGEVFYTDAILTELGIPYYETFDAAHITDGIDLAIHSAAYSVETNPELQELKRRNIPVMKYTEALGAWSARFDSSGVAGVHGKTTTTAISGTLIRAAGLPAQILAGSAVSSFAGADGGARSTLSLGEKYFVAETCEYRRHFLSFRPNRIVLTSVESDHQDFFPDYEAIRDAFIEYCMLLPHGGRLMYCADDTGASETAAIVRQRRNDLALVPYGFTAPGAYHIGSYHVKNERGVMKLNGFPLELRLRVPGRHIALDAAAAVALTASLLQTEHGCTDGEVWTGRAESIQKALENFRGSRRRSEILGEAGGVLFMDDYGHHPTAIKTTLAGLKEFYPARRLVVSFMSHTYTRTAALLDDFASAFGDADVLVLHKIYGSARETSCASGPFTGGVTGETLYEKTKACRRAAGKTEADTLFIAEHEDAATPAASLLRPGDLFITMGAGDNWKLGEALYKRFRREEKP